jgi:hypothetical protein
MWAAECPSSAAQATENSKKTCYILHYEDIITLSKGIMNNFKTKS